MSSVKPTIDYSTKDYEGFREDLINMLKVKIPEYSDFSQSDAGIVIIELLSYGLDILSYYTDKSANELFFDTAQERESLIKLCKFLNYTILGSTASKVYQVMEIVPRTTPFVISKGTQFKTNAVLDTDKIIFELESNFTYPANVTGLEKDSNGDYIYQLPLVQGYTITNNIIGTSNATSYQTFKLNYTPVISDSIMVYVNEGSGYKLWSQVDNFIDSDAYSEVYKSYENGSQETIIEFGSGSSGKIPKVYQNGLMSTYRVGGGVQGNITANSITTLVTNIAGITSTFNPSTPYELAQDAEGIESIRINAPASLRTIGDRVVSLTDYTDMVISRGDVLLATSKAMADKFTILITLLLKNGVALTPAITQDIIDDFEDKKEIGYVITTQEATKLPMDLVINVTTYPRYVMLDIKTSTEDLANQYLSLGNLAIGEEFIPASLSAQIMALSGVKNVGVTCDTTITEYQVTTLGTLTVNVTGGV